MATDALLAADAADGLSAALHPPDSSVEQLPVHGYRPDRADWQPRPAAVLVAISEAPDRGIVLTERSRRMSLHAGQIAFPGGRPESGESFPLETALRESSEEIGIGAAALDIHGLMDAYDTLTGFRIVPVVASIRGRPELRACPGEVDAIFRLPLERVLDAGEYRFHRVRRAGRDHELISMPHRQRLIWGATAAILHQLRRRLASVAPSGRRL
jgi:8-oxo-dGTP pyrophosphatase MutT (NUDIX family)